MGSKDTNGWAMPWYTSEGWGEFPFYIWLQTTTNLDASELMTQNEQIFASFGSSAEFRLYLGEDHSTTQQQFDDCIEFLKNYSKTDPDY